MRHAQKSIREYHQKSPSFAWSFLNTRAVYHFLGVIASIYVFHLRSAQILLKFGTRHKCFLLYYAP